MSKYTQSYEKWQLFLHNLINIQYIFFNKHFIVENIQNAINYF